MSIYLEECKKVISKVLADHRNSTYEAKASELQKAFPFTKGNLPAWKVYRDEIYNQSKIKMLGKV